jgi:homoserine kinase
VTAAAAAAAVRAVGTEPERLRVYEVLAGVEGHGDNAAPAVWGGLMAVGSNGPHRLEMNGDLVPVVGIPDRPLSTKRARTVLPETVPLTDAVGNVARAVLLVEALRTGDPAAFAAAAGDAFHESQRGPLSPITGRLMEAAGAAGALHVSWSGAGPTALALAAAGTEHAVVAAMTAAIGDAGTVKVLSVDYDGLR